MEWLAENGDEPRQRTDSFVIDDNYARGLEILIESWVDGQKMKMNQ